jgi:hypothetical protein
LTGRPWFWAAAVGALFAGPLLRGLTQGRAPAPPPVLGTFPDFALPADDGRRFSASDLRGRPFIADLLLDDDGAGVRAGTMRTLQHRTRNLGDALWLVSFSEKLGPGALSALRHSHAAGQRWTLLSGVPDGPAPLFSGEDTVLLVDGQRRIRGRYQAAKEGEIDRLLHDAALVAALR